MTFWTITGWVIFGGLIGTLAIVGAGSAITYHVCRSCRHWARYGTDTDGLCDTCAATADALADLTEFHQHAKQWRDGL